MENQENIPPIEPGVNINNMLNQIEVQLTDCEGLAEDLEFGLEERIEFLDTPQRMEEMIRFCRDQMEIQPRNIQVLQHNISLLQRILSTNNIINGTNRYNRRNAIVLLEHYIECFQRLRDDLEIAFQFLNV
jgi:hypothetical protein